VIFDPGVRQYSLVTSAAAPQLSPCVVCSQAFKFGLYVTVPIGLYVFVAYFPAGLDYFVNKVCCRTQLHHDGFYFIVQRTQVLTLHGVQFQYVVYPPADEKGLAYKFNKEREAREQ
jgi:hypothetical protein